MGSVCYPMGVNSGEMLDAPSLCAEKAARESGKRYSKDLGTHLVPGKDSFGVKNALGRSP